MTTADLYLNEMGKWQIRWRGLAGESESGVRYATLDAARVMVHDCAPSGDVTIAVKS